MFRLLHAAFIAASLQVVVIIILTLCVSLFAPPFMNCSNATPIVGACELFWNSVSIFLICAYLLAAIGLALTHNRSIEITAHRVRAALPAAALAKRERTLMLLVIQPAICAIAFAVVALQSPPNLLLSVLSRFGLGPAGAIIWGAAMSVGVAAFGASAHAALKALGER